MLKEYLESHGIQQKELAKILNIDKYQMSKIANHKCMPTPAQAQAIVNYLKCNVNEIFPKDYINFKIANLRRKNKSNDKKFYRLCVKLDLASCNCLKLQNLHLLGYKTLKEWVEKQIKNFEIELIKYRQDIVSKALQDILIVIKNNKQPSQEEITQLVNTIMQKYFYDMPQCAELMQELISQAYCIVRTHNALLDTM